MEDGKPDESDTEGEEANSDTKDNPSPVEKQEQTYEKIKAVNDKVEAEMLRGEQLRATIAQGGKSIAGQELEKPKEESDKEYSDRIDTEIREGKFNG